MGEHICFRRNERLATVNPYWRGNPMVRGRFFNRQHRFRPGMGSVLKWRLSPNPQRKEKKTVKWDPKVCYLRSLDAVVGDSLIWLGHNSFFLQLAGKRIMFDPVFGSIPFVKRQSEFPANPDIFTEIDYLLVSHDHFDQYIAGEDLPLYGLGAVVGDFRHGLHGDVDLQDQIAHVAVFHSLFNRGLYGVFIT